MQKATEKTGLKVQNAPINASLSPLQQQILGVLSQDPKASYELLVSKLGKDRTTIMRNIQKMKEAGILRRLGSKKIGHWEIL
jgi:ATP-dependent DNA helicase RecG